jgi:WhiB family redox-sensing transcriptional regulator
MKTAEQIYMQLANAIEAAEDIPPCQTTDPEIWFSDDQEGSGTHYKLAKKLCGECPVQNLCLEFALSSEEQFGVWGGLTPRERRAMRVARGRTRGRRAA